MKRRKRDGEKINGRIGRRRAKNRKAAHSLAAQRAGEKLRQHSRPSCRLLPCRQHKSSYMQCRLMRRCPLGRSHRRTSLRRLLACSLASAARTVRRPGSSNITASCVRAGVGAVTLTASRRPRRHAVPAAWRSARQLAGIRHARRSVLAHGHQAHAKKSARKSNPA